MFEHLTRRLFDKIGIESWTTSTTNNGGVDAIGVYDNSALGGLCVVQAKRYTRPVELETIQAFAETMADQRAAKGILTTTSWVGSAGHEFARHEAIQLEALLRKHLGVESQINLPKFPRRWKEDDLP